MHAIGDLALLALLLGVGGWIWVREIRRHPRKPCLWCGGSSKSFGHGVGRRPFGDCWLCHGDGERRRLGAVLLGLDRSGRKRGR